MKKIFLFVTALTLSLTSCSSDDSSGGNDPEGNQPTSELKVTIDGVAKTFNTVSVNEVTVDDDFPMLFVTASINNSPSDIISFYVPKDNVGTEVIWEFKYKRGSSIFYRGYLIASGEERFLSDIIQINSNGKLKGTFEATLGDQDGNKVELTNGSFDLTYELE